MTKNPNELARLKTLAQLLDSKFSGPFGTKFGLDAIIGLIPGVGDVITSCISLYIIAMSASLGVGAATLSRMAINVLVDNLIDMVPIIGNLFDFYWKSNEKNLRLLEAHMANPEAETIKSRMIVALIAVLLLSVLIASGYITYLMIMTVVGWMTARLD